MKRKHLLTMIDELGIKVTSDRPLTKTELVWVIKHHAAHLTVEVEHLQAKRDHYEKIGQDLMAIILRHEGARNDLAASLM